MSAASTRFQRFLLPGLAFKAVVIGGGYATGRELVEFFLPSGPVGGCLAILLATVIWSAVCVVTFLFARLTGSYDYRTFFRRLLGPAGVLFELAYLLFALLILAVFGAAAGALGASILGLPSLVGALALVLAIAAFATFGNAAVEQLFKWVSVALYGVYALFVVFAFSTFGDRILDQFATPAPITGWWLGGTTYAGYNIIGAVLILPVLRHLTSDRDAVTAGLLAGPLAMAPALLFFCCMIAFYPQIGGQTLPSDFLLQQLRMPAFHVVFQVMIFLALLESGTGIVHAINERAAATYAERAGRPLGARARLLIAGGILIVAVFVADRVGLVELIAKGYRALAIVFLTIYVAPLLTYGIWRLKRGAPTRPAGAKGAPYEAETR
ncbi:YkvI family membrane protein [Caulobacter mirabilis]|uniref:Membrane protein YkvI n=1 Tax=Caulobacter mirabilis TaxID=69666 RepID=A0A2D2AZC4_9CAUL|nr:hypothetical protein [Caulobacter mirabilis]ATQ43366.1 hypothetical protein CSW64_13555 [Caulobacter mirabilis]